jgi:SAM-dependent methyltransferase
MLATMQGKGRGAREVEKVYPTVRSLLDDGPAGHLAAWQNRLTAHQYGLLYETTLNSLAPEAKVLDWGCGTGHFSYFLAQAGYRVTGYSLRPCALAGAIGARFEERYAFVEGSVLETVALPFDDEAFDAVFSVGVLEHVRELDGDEARSLAELRRVLRPGGCFICFHLPNQWSAIELGVRALTRRYHHVFRYTRRDVERLCGAAGLDLLWHTRYGIVPRNILGRLPGPLAGPRSAALVNAVDASMSALLRGVAQNHAFIARRPEGPVVMR